MTGAPTLRVLSLGAGVQSTTIALFAVEGALPRPDAAIFADTGWEPQSVYDHLARLRPVMEAAGIPVHIVGRGNLRADHLDAAHPFSSMPLFVRGKDGRAAIGRRQCTSEYKLAPIKRKMRELLGAAAPNYRRVPVGKTCEQWVGFSTDEVHRVGGTKYDPRYLTTRYPLLDLGMSRKDCERWLRIRGWSTTKSACIGCPFHGNRAWRDLRDNHPSEWADAVKFDAAIRAAPRGPRSKINGEQFLHRSLIPLSVAPIDKVTRSEWHARQGDILDAIADDEAEDGDPDGCSPYGCRSGGTA